MTTTADKVRAAADHIEKYGLHKGSMYADAALRGADQLPEVTQHGIPCCAVGALHTFGVNNDEARRAVALAAGPDVWNDGLDQIPDWNDAPERTAEDVVTALRKAADELEAGRA